MYVEVLLGAGDRNGGCQMGMEKAVEDGGGAVKGDGGRGSEVQCSATSAHIISAGDVSVSWSLCRSAGLSGPLSAQCTSYGYAHNAYIFVKIYV